MKGRRMGNSNWNPSQYGNYSRSVSSKSQQQIFTNTSGCHKDLDPSKFEVRESIDSPANPESTPIILAVDCTGSMGILAIQIIKEGLGIIMDNVISRKPVTDPHILLAAIGDCFCDRSPIQATQFEADMKLVQQIEKIFIEGGGGGNGGESYLSIWWFAANKTKCDAFDKRSRKGYLFTIGDESCHTALRGSDIKEFFGVDSEDVSAESLLHSCQQNWNVFHLITPTGATEDQNAIVKWRELLGERAIMIDDWKKMAEVIVSLMQVNEGQSKDDVIGSWDNKTGRIVAAAIKSLSDPASLALKVQTI
jgi:hypothetical protein